MMPLRHKIEIRLGMAIRAFMQSARFQTTARLMTLPIRTAAI